MTAKLLNRQSNKAHKEAEAQKAKVKKVTLPSEIGLLNQGYSTRDQ
jgi:hypothetical protein